jgi:hypothetical protein
MAVIGTLDVTRVRIPFWSYWGGALASLTAVLLSLAIQFGHLPELAKLLPIWHGEADAIAPDKAPPADQATAPPVPRGYSLYYADAGHALILYDRNLIVVSPGSALPDGSTVSDLSPDKLVTTAGRTLRVH